MLGLLYTFHAASPQPDAQMSSQLARALDVARAGEQIAYAQVADARDERTQVAVLFSDLGQLDGFTARLVSALAPCGIALAAVRPSRAA